ncbi:MAG: phage tail tape measure protein [Chromatiales bacterium]|nr:phage tail tape measure protein [Chromatiales bacterium]
MAVDIAKLAVQVEAIGADKARQQLDQVRDATAKTETATGQLEAGFRRLGVAMAGLFAAERLIAFLGQSAAAAGRLQSSLTSAAGAMGFTSTQLRALEDASRRLAIGTTFSSEQVGNAFEALAQDAGGLAETPQQLEAITAAAVTLAQATRSDLNDAGETLVAIMRQFGGSADQAINAIAELGSTAPELADVAQAFGAVGNVAATLGLRVPETAAALKLLGDAGIEGATAGTALRGVLLQLEEQVDSSLRPSVVGLEEALTNARVAQISWSDRSFAAAQILTGQSGQLRQLTVDIGESRKATELAEQTLTTYEARVKAMEAAFASLSAEVGKSLTPGLGEAAVTGMELANALNELFRSTSASTSEFSLLAEAASKGSAIIYGLASGFVALGENIAGATATAAAFLSLDFDEAGNRWDFWMANRESRAQKFEAEFYRIWDGVRSKIDGATQGLSPEVETFGAELDAAGSAMAAGVLASIPALPGDNKQPATRQATYSDAAAYMAQAEIANAASEIDALQRKFDMELAAYAQQGTRLVEAGVLNEQERAAAILAMRSAHEAELTDAVMAAQKQRAATLLALQDQLATDETERERLALERRLQMRYDALRDVGVPELEAHTQIAALRDRGQAEIEAKAAAHAKRMADIERQKWLGQVSSAITGTGALLGIISGSSEKAFKVQQAAAIASGLVNVYASASKAYLNALEEKKNPVAAAAMAGLASSAQLAQVTSMRGIGIGSGGAAPSSGGIGGIGGSSAATFRETPYGDAPSVGLIRDTPKRGPSVEIHNYSGGEVTTETRPGPDGTEIIAVVVQAVAQDIATSGPVAQTLQRRFGLNPRLGVRS